MKLILESKLKIGPIEMTGVVALLAVLLGTGLIVYFGTDLLDIYKTEAKQNVD